MKGFLVGALLLRTLNAQTTYTDDFGQIVVLSDTPTASAAESTPAILDPSSAEAAPIVTSTDELVTASAAPEAAASSEEALASSAELAASTEDPFAEVSATPEAAVASESEAAVPEPSSAAELAPAEASADVSAEPLVEPTVTDELGTTEPSAAPDALSAGPEPTSEEAAAITPDASAVDPFGIAPLIDASAFPDVVTALPGVAAAESSEAPFDFPVGSADVLLESSTGLAAAEATPVLLPGGETAIVLPPQPGVTGAAVLPSAAFAGLAAGDSPAAAGVGALAGPAGGAFGAAAVGVGDDATNYDGQDYGWGEGDEKKKALTDAYKWHQFDPQCPWWCYRVFDAFTNRDDGSGTNLGPVIKAGEKRQEPASDGGFASFSWPTEEGSKAQALDDDIPDWAYGDKGRPKPSPAPPTYKCPWKCYQKPSTTSTPKTWKTRSSRSWWTRKPTTTSDSWTDSWTDTPTWGPTESSTSGYPSSTPTSWSKTWPPPWKSTTTTTYTKTTTTMVTSTKSRHPWCPPNRPCPPRPCPPGASCPPKPWLSTKWDKPWETPKPWEKPKPEWEKPKPEWEKPKPEWEKPKPEWEKPKPEESKPEAESWDKKPQWKDWTGDTLADICPKTCDPIPGKNWCDITTSCTVTGGDKGRTYCACRAGFRASAWNPKDFSKQFKVEGQPYVYVAPGVVCDKPCDDQTCNDVLERPKCK